MENKPKINWDSLKSDAEKRGGHFYTNVKVYQSDDGKSSMLTDQEGNILYYFGDGFILRADEIPFKNINEILKGE